MTLLPAMPIIGALSVFLCGLLSAFLLFVPGPLRRPNDSRAEMTADFGSQADMSR